ncbi:MAG: hypothetical protein JSR48_08165 [Verrucomicrobia bacterium]|nr:hypothetical protein [Verrucomicrobiota bacterium]
MNPPFATRTWIIAGLILISLAPAARAQIGIAADGSGKSISNKLIEASAPSAIECYDFAARNQLYLDVQTRIDSAASSLRELARHLASKPEQLRERVNEALKDARTQEAALKLNLQSVAKATLESWPKVRAVVAQSYVNYVSAVARVETAVAEH